MSKNYSESERAQLFIDLITGFKKYFPEGVVEVISDGSDGWVQLAVQPIAGDENPCYECGWPDEEWVCPNSLSGTVKVKGTNTILRFDGEDGGFWSGSLEEWTENFLRTAD